MNKIVRENFPVVQLPSELRDELKGLTYVRLTLEDQTAYPVTSGDEYVALGFGMPLAKDDPAERISALRDEWEDRLDSLRPHAGLSEAR